MDESKGGKKREANKIVCSLEFSMRFGTRREPERSGGDCEGGRLQLLSTE